MNSFKGCIKPKVSNDIDEDVIYQGGGFHPPTSMNWLDEITAVGSRELGHCKSCRETI